MIITATTVALYVLLAYWYSFVFKQESPNKTEETNVNEDMGVLRYSTIIYHKSAEQWLQPTCGNPGNDNRKKELFETVLEWRAQPNNF